MKAGNILIKTRQYLRDLQASRFSDWEIYQGINDALRIFAEEASRIYDGAGAFSSVKTLSMGADGKALLPESYLKVKRAYSSDGSELLRVISSAPGEGEFAIRGNVLMSGEPSVKLNYYSYPEKVDQPEDVVDLPESMLLPIAKIAASCAAGSDNATVQVAQYFSGQALSNLTGGESE